MLLALDTATPAVTVAVADGARVLAERTVVDVRRHGELLAPTVVAVLRDAGVDRRDLTGVGVGVGPGPFTGLRVGLVTARTLGATLDVPVTGVCTLDVLALQAVQGAQPALARSYDVFRVVTDARRKEVYWAAYVTAGGDVSGGGTGGLRRVDGPHVHAPAAASWDGLAVGAGAALYPEQFPGHREPGLPSAAALCAWLAAGHPTLPPEPLYLRRPDAVEPATRKRVS